MCLPGEHAYTRDGSILFCGLCGDVKHLTPAQKARPQRQPRTRVTQRPPAMPPDPSLFDAPENADDLEAAIESAARDIAAGTDPNEAFNRITSRFQVPNEPPIERTVPVDNDDEGLGPRL